ncbi:MAG TPA: BrnA antitoxin family protein [Caulobacteraceae bacterium]
MSAENTRMVTFDPSKITDAERERQRIELERLAALPDEEIDLSDIPEITDEQWATRRPGRHFRPIKERVTIRLDADVLDWFKREAEGGRYQTRMNQALRRYMQEQLKLKKRA